MEVGAHASSGDSGEDDGISIVEVKLLFKKLELFEYVAISSEIQFGVFVGDGVG